LAAGAIALQKQESPIQNVDLITGLYRKHATALRQVRMEQRNLYANRGNLHLERIASCLQLRSVLDVLGMPADYHRLIKPQLDDIEAEITYLLLREFRPHTVVETPRTAAGPRRGYSPPAGQRVGRLFSYDIFDHSTRTVPRSCGRPLTFRRGITQQLPFLPLRIDYLFLDCAHTAEFARWYLRELFPRLSPGTPVSIDDIYPESPGESRVVRNWLTEQGVAHFTSAPEVAPGIYDRLMRVKRELGLDECIHSSRRNPMVFFRLPQELPSHSDRSGTRARLSNSAEHWPVHATLAAQDRS
jgi:hypothetical protein